MTPPTTVASTVQVVADRLQFRVAPLKATKLEPPSRSYLKCTFPINYLISIF